MASIPLADIAAKAGPYPSRAARFGATLAKFAESVQASVPAPFPSYADLTAANLVLNAGDIYYDVALGTYRSAT